MFCMHLAEKIEWYGCEKIKTDTTQSERSHKLYGKEAYEHSSKSANGHLEEMMEYIARKDEIKRVSDMLHLSSNEDTITSEPMGNTCSVSLAPHRSVQLMYDNVANKWKLPPDDSKGRSSNLFHPLLNMRLLHEILEKYIQKRKGKNCNNNKYNIY